MLMSEKLNRAEPYNLFFSSHSDIEETLDNERFITFSDLFCPSLGKLKSLYLFTDILDIEWLLEECDKAGYSNIPLKIFYGKEDPQIKAYLTTYVHSNVTVCNVKSSDKFGKHHCKFGIFIYEDNSLRLVISGANLDRLGWTSYCQTIWVSPLCMPAVDAKKDDGPTNFKTSLLKYLNEYKLNSSSLSDCIEHLKETDFSNIKVFLVTSVPGSHKVNNLNSECHSERVAELLSRYCTLSNEELECNRWPIIIQAPTIGNFGYAQNQWFGAALLRSIDSYKLNHKPQHSNATANIIYPTVKDVMNSLSKNAEPETRINCFPAREEWLKKMLCSWRAEKVHLTKVVPCSKYYCRISPCGAKLAWFLLTSANPTKTAWGGYVTKSSSIYARSFELGILFLPHLFGEEHFKIGDNDRNVFPLMFDIPLTPYNENDMAWNCP